MTKRHRTESKTSPRRLAAAERQRQALALRTGGANFEEIAEALGYKGRNGAYTAVMAALARIPEAEVAAYRKLNMERLNQMRLQYWRLAKAGDLEAMEMELKVQTQEAHYLGLYAPVKQELSGPGGGPIQVDAALLAKLQHISQTQGGQTVEGQFTIADHPEPAALTEPVYPEALRMKPSSKTPTVRMKRKRKTGDETR